MNEDKHIFHFFKEDLEKGQVKRCEFCNCPIRNFYYIHEICHKIECIYFRKVICEECLKLKGNIEEKKLLPPEEFLYETNIKNDK